jgi:radical SAM-linked protein
MSEVRQRWRLVFARDEEARYLSHLDAVKLWERAFRRGAIPVATSEGFSPRPRLIFAAPLPLGMLAEHELADLFLAERLTLPDLRARLAGGMPRGYRLVDLRDEWLGASALATQLAAADYRVTVLGADRAAVEAAAAALLGAKRLDRVRHREGKATAYDLRPLLLELRPLPADGAGAGDGAVGLWMRLRHTQDQGSGRAEEVVAALAAQLGLGAAGPDEPGPGEPGAPGSDGLGLEMVAPVRERLWLAGEIGTDGAVAP